ncbi:MAG: hypothetical protein QOJ32_2082, partial [Frankiaceae bacterium]|nr:hypothetical protein [Frankiaceae bacterium]
MRLRRRGVVIALLVLAALVAGVVGLVAATRSGG